MFHSVHIWKPNLLVDWRLMVKERIANIGIPLDAFLLTVSMIFVHLERATTQAVTSDKEEHFYQS